MVGDARFPVVSFVFQLRFSVVSWKRKVRVPRMLVVGSLIEMSILAVGVQRNSLGRAFVGFFQCVTRWWAWSATVGGVRMLVVGNIVQMCISW